MRHLLVSLFLLLGFAAPALAQLGAPAYVFAPRTTIRSAEVNALIADIYSRALNREGGTMTGALVGEDITSSTVFAQASTYSSAYIGQFPETTELGFLASGFTYPPRLYLRAARGTRASPAAVQEGDALGRWSFSGYYDSDWVTAFRIDIDVADPPSTDTIPADVVFRIEDGNYQFRIGDTAILQMLADGINVTGSYFIGSVEGETAECAAGSSVTVTGGIVTACTPVIPDLLARIEMLEQQLSRPAFCPAQKP